MNDKPADTKLPPTSRQIQLPPPRVASIHAAAARSDNAAVHPIGSLAGQKLESLTAELETLVCNPGDIVSLASNAIRLAGSLNKVMAAGYFVANKSGTLNLAAHNWTGFVFERESFRKQLNVACETASKTKLRQTYACEEIKNLVTLCIPINVKGQPSDVLAVSVTATVDQPEYEHAVALELIVSCLRLCHSELTAAKRDAELHGLAAVVELVKEIEQSPTLNRACHSLVNELKDYFGCHRVALGLVQRSFAGCRLTTLSGVGKFDQYSDVARHFQSACNETAVRETLAAWPALNPNVEHATIALRQLAEQQNVGTTVGLPLLSDHRVVGVLIFAGRKEQLQESATLNLLQTAAPILASALQVAIRLRGNLLVRSWRRLTSSRWTTRIAVASAVAATTAILCLPWPYTMNVSCTLEPMTRRIVSAPYDGLLEVSMTEPGSVVQQGQILARMDAREIRWERSTITAERSHALKEFDTELAQENIAKAHLARLEAERLQLKLDLLQHRERNHELVSPIEGMVLNGSLDKLTGAPVKMGQPLYEVAELNPLRLELAVPAEDYFNIKSGQAVSVSFDGFDGEDFKGTILRIRPRSEIRDDKNVYVAEVEVQNSDFRLRPGIQGSATITGDRHSIAWNTFHKAWESLWRTDPTAILADGRSVGSVGDTNMALVARSRASEPPLSDETQLANRNKGIATPSVTSPGNSRPTTRMAVLPDEQLKTQ